MAPAGEPGHRPSPPRDFGPEVRIDPTAFVAPTALVYGRVEVAEHASLWPGCVIRAECQEVRVGRYTNLQDQVVVHVGYDAPAHIGEFCSITHRAVVHGARVEDDCLIGIGAILMDGAVIGAGSIVAPGAVVTEGTKIPPGSIVVGIPARVIRQRDARRENRLNAWKYVWNARGYREGRHRNWVGADYERFLREVEARLDSDAGGGPAEA